jgi:hypothetical protein
MQAVNTQHARSIVTLPRHANAADQGREAQPLHCINRLDQPNLETSASAP